MASDYCEKYRLESLKMAHEVIFRIGNMNYLSGISGEFVSEQFRMDIKNATREDLKDIFSLADMYYDYILCHQTPSFDDDVEK